MKKIGDRVGENIIKLYDTLKAKLAHTPAKEALAKLEAEPNNTDLQASLRVHLKDALVKEDKALQDELAAILQTIEATPGEVSQNSTNIGNNNQTFQNTGAGNNVRFR